MRHALTYSRSRLRGMGIWCYGALAPLRHRVSEGDIAWVILAYVYAAERGPWSTRCGKWAAELSVTDVSAGLDVAQRRTPSVGDRLAAIEVCEPAAPLEEAKWRILGIIARNTDVLVPGMTEGSQDGYQSRDGSFAATLPSMRR